MTAAPSRTPSHTADLRCADLMDRCERFLRRIAPAASLALLVVIVYAQTVHFRFLNWDDGWYILRNDLITSWHPANLYRILTEPVARNYAPLTIFTFLIDHTLWGTVPGGYHAVNVLLHAVNAVLVFMLLRQLTGNAWLSWTVAALFAVHPVQVEAVAWVSSRKTLLSSTCMLASLICWLRPERTTRQEGWGCFWLVLGLLSKASCVVMPGIVIVYDVLIVRKRLAESIARQFVPLCFCLMLLFVTMQAQVTVVGGVRKHIGLSTMHLLAIDTTLLWRYVGMLLYPQGLCVLYDPPFRDINGMILLAAAGWGVVAMLLWKLRNRVPLLALAGAAWLLLFLPVMNLFPLTTLMNDRYLYLPCVPFFAGVLGIIEWSARLTVKRFSARSSQGVALTAETSLEVGVTPKWRPAFRGLTTAVLLGAFAWQTLSYLPVWSSPLRLWENACVETPSLPVVHFQWALTLEEHGRYQEAAEALRYALQHCDPDEPDTQRIMAMLLKLHRMPTRTAHL